jgi:hypothetical protein
MSRANPLRGSFFCDRGPVQFANVSPMRGRLRATPPQTDRAASYSHSMVLGGFELMS